MNDVRGRPERSLPGAHSTCKTLWSRYLGFSALRYNHWRAGFLQVVRVNVPERKERRSVRGGLRKPETVRVVSFNCESNLVVRALWHGIIQQEHKTMRLSSF